MFESVLRSKHKLIPILRKRGVFIVVKLGTGDALSQGQWLNRRQRGKVGESDDNLPL